LRSRQAFLSIGKAHLARADLCLSGGDGRFARALLEFGEGADLLVELRLRLRNRALQVGRVELRQGLTSMRERWDSMRLATRVTLWYTLLLGALLIVVGVVVAGAVSRWVQAETMTQLTMKAQLVRLALTTVAASAPNDQVFASGAARVLNEVLGRDIQGSVWAADGRLIARSEGFYFPEESPGGGIGVFTFDEMGLPTEPSLATTVMIGQATDAEPGTANYAVLRQHLAESGGARFAMVVLTLNDLPEHLVGTSTAYPDVPPLARAGVRPAGAMFALTASSGRETAAVTSVLSTLGLAGVAAVLLGAIIAQRIARRGLQPLEAVVSASQRMAAGELDTRVPVPPGRDEVGRLARAFNDMASQLDAAFAAQRAFVADASHELRTPLAALRGQVDVLRRALRDEPVDADRLADSLRRELARLSRLVDDLLVLARLEAVGPAALAPKSVDVCSVAADVCAQVAALPAARQRQIRLDAPGPVRITADSERLHQVLLNLVDNAVKYTPPGGCVAVRVERAARGARIAVQDSGPGIADADLPHLFDRFYRAESGRRGGAGLGLAIARAIVAAHGGHISAANSPRGGAIFSVEIPSLTAANATGTSHDVLGAAR
jgi:signal transduction histidine kinase